MALRSIAWEGRFLVVGFAAGEIPKIPLNLLLLKGCDVLGVFWGEFLRRTPEKQKANMEEILSLARAGKISAHVDAVYPLERAAEALNALANRKVKGKVVLKP